MLPELTSQRLRLAPFRRDDLDSLHKLWTAAPLREHLWDGEKVTRVQAEAVVREAVADAARTRIGMWTLHLPDDPGLAGFCGFRWMGIPPQVELLYGIRPDLWGLGLAGEAARTCLAWLFDTHPVTHVLAGTSASNERSLRLLQRLGFQPMPERPAGPPTIDYYRLTRERFVR